MAPTRQACGSPSTKVSLPNSSPPPPSSLQQLKILISFFSVFFLFSPGGGESNRAGGHQRERKERSSDLEKGASALETRAHVRERRDGDSGLLDFSHIYCQSPNNSRVQINVPQSSKNRPITNDTDEGWLLEKSQQ